VEVFIVGVIAVAVGAKVELFVVGVIADAVGARVGAFVVEIIDDAVGEKVGVSVARVTAGTDGDKFRILDEVVGAWVREREEPGGEIITFLSSVWSAEATRTISRVSKTSAFTSVPKDASIVKRKIKIHGVKLRNLAMAETSVIA